MWPRRKNKPPTPPPTTTAAPPTSHRRPTAPDTPAIEPLALRWLLADAEWLDQAAEADENQAAALLARAAERRAVAASYLRLAAAHTQPAQPDPQPLAEAAPQPDPWRHNPTWQIPAQFPARAACACQWGRGESCSQCDHLIPAPSPWRPYQPLDAADGSTVTFQAVNGEAQ